MSEYDCNKDERVLDLIAVSEAIIQQRLRDLRRSHHPDLWERAEEYEREQHTKRVAGIQRYFIEKETGLPF